MALSWSHAFEAYIYARGELSDMSRPLLLEILGEWRMHDRHAGNDAAWADQWPVVMRGVRRWALGRHKESIVEEIWQRAFAQKTCDNGGWNAWMCPYGCHPHCVDFGPEDSELHPRVMREEVLV